jgi:hypothetical protein
MLWPVDISVMFDVSDESGSRIRVYGAHFMIVRQIIIRVKITLL